MFPLVGINHNVSHTFWSLVRKKDALKDRNQEAVITDFSQKEMRGDVGEPNKQGGK